MADFAYLAATVVAVYLQIMQLCNTYMHIVMEVAHPICTFCLASQLHPGL